MDQRPSLKMLNEKKASIGSKSKWGRRARSQICFYVFNKVHCGMPL